MNRVEIKTIRDAAQLFMKHATASPVIDVSNCIKIELPFLGYDQKPLHMFVIKRKDSRRFSIIVHIEASGILSTRDSMAILQPVLKTYGLLLSAEAVIMEENIDIPLHRRISAMAQALIGLDGLRRLWQSESNRSSNAASEVTR